MNTTTVYDTYVGLGSHKVITDPGDFALAALLAAIAAINTVLPTLTIPPPLSPKPMLLTASAASVAMAWLIAMLISGQFNLPFTKVLTWVLVGVIPIALAAVILAAASSLGGKPSLAQIKQLHFPITVTILAALSMATINASYGYSLPWSANLSARTAAAGLGIATAALITPRGYPLPFRLFVGIAIAGYYAWSLTPNSETALAAGFICIADAWWIIRSCQVLRQTLRETEKRPWPAKT
jgi:hypothetical protein